MTTRNELLFDKVKIKSGADVTGTGTKFLTNENPTLIGNLTLDSIPTAANHAVTKAYADALTNGLDLKYSCRVATTGNITLSGTQTIDGVAVVVGNRVLVKDQTTATENGIYVVAAGAWSRSDDADNTPGAEVSGGMFTFVEDGTMNADSGWVLVSPNGSVTLGTDNLVFTQFSGAGSVTAGNGLTQSGTLINVVGTLNRIDVFADNVDIAATYIGQTSLTTLGTITTGVWNGTTIAVANGGTGATTLTGVLIGNGTSAFTAVPGTPNNLVKFTSGSVSDSLITDNGTLISLGSLFVVTAASGNLAINTTMFTVDGSNGNTLIAGTLGVTGLASVGSLDIGSLSGILIGTSGLVSAVTGTANTVVKFGALGATLADSSITDDGVSVTINLDTDIIGSLSVDTNLTVVNDLNVGGGNFTVSGATGNTAIAGTLGVTGATTLSSTLGLTGYATFTSGLTLNTNNDISTVGNVPTWLEYTKAFGDFDGNVDVALFTLPVGYVMHMIRTFVDTAFDNNRNISVGTSGNPSEYTTAINTTATNQQLTTVNEVVDASTGVIAKASGSDSASGSIKFYVLVSRANL